MRDLLPPRPPATRRAEGRLPRPNASTDVVARRTARAQLARLRTMADRPGELTSAMWRALEDGTVAQDGASPDSFHAAVFARAAAPAPTSPAPTSTLYATQRFAAGKRSKRLSLGSNP